MNIRPYRHINARAAAECSLCRERQLFVPPRVRVQQRTAMSDYTRDVNQLITMSARRVFARPYTRRKML